MSNGRLAEYFEKRNAQWHIPHYEIGDRVRGFYEGIPFTGCVGVDGIRNLDEGPIVTVTLDLPIMIDGNLKSVIITKHKDIGRANEFCFQLGESDDGNEINQRKIRRTNSKTQRSGTGSDGSGLQVRGKRKSTSDQKEKA